jgi:hypothetical protein
MNLLLSLAEACPPGLLLRRKIGELFALTADAFGSEPPALPDRSWAGSLRSYALYTRAEVDRAASAGADLAAIRERLRRNAQAFGEKLRASLRIRTPRAGRKGLALLYRALRIDFRADGNGAVVVPRCFFSGFYTPDTCRVVSGLDEGLAAGFCGGRLEFRQRITEGSGCCRASLAFEGLAS